MRLLKPIVITSLFVIAMATFGQSRQVTSGSSSARAIASGTLVVQGQGEVKLAPDKATVNAGVTTEAATATEAVDANNAIMIRLIAAIEAAGIASNDIQTANFNVYPRYNYSNGQSRLIGYMASNNVSVVSRDIASVGSLLDTMSGAGATQINGIYFDVEDDDAAQDQALAAAVSDAFNKANVLANAAGVTLGAPIAIDSTNGAAQVYVPLNRGASELANSDAVPISPGENTVATMVTIVYEIQ